MQSSSRNGAKVRLLAVHTTEGILRAPDLAAFFNRANATGSSHASADDTGALLGPESGYVPYDRAAWTLRNGNPVSENLEYCGWARWTRAEWLTRPQGLEAIARWLAERSKARGIPLVKLTPAEVKAGKSGVIGHVDWTEGMKDGTHWDPGPGFPWDVVLDRARQLANPATTAPQEDDDMPTPMYDFVPAGEKRTYSIPPPEAGGAGWGRAWLSVEFDRHGADGAGAPAPTFIRVGIQGEDGTWRPAWGADMTLPLRPSTRPIVQLRKGDQALVVASLDKEYGVGWLIEYAAR